jgi:hypothetical protein
MIKPKPDTVSTDSFFRKALALGGFFFFSISSFSSHLRHFILRGC